jgi:hypothetical protein
MAADGYLFDSEGFDRLLCLETGKTSGFRLSSMPAFQAKKGAGKQKKKIAADAA